MINLDKLLKRFATSIAFGAIVTTATIGASTGFLQEEKPKKPAVTKKQEDPEEKADEEEKPTEEEKDAKDEEKDKKKKKKTLIKTLVKDHDYMEGLFKVYRNPKNGSLSMEVRDDQIGKEFIYFSHITNGVVEGGHFRGQFRSQKVFTIEKQYNQIAFVEQNPYFYFDPDSNLAKAQDANISRSVMATSRIRGTNEEETTYLINVDGLFKGESFDQIKPSNNPRTPPGQSFSLGKLSSGKTRITDVHNYPENIAVSVDYVYSNPSPVNRGNWFDITDARNITVGVQHTLVAMPENDYKPRFDDARVGYFIDYVNDQTTTSATPWRDMINRWHLVKKDPSAAISEPVEPIVWWIENTTPEDIRPIIKSAAEAWNPAFEAAGFRNAIQVKIQPDDADWDAGDIRYNVLRWTSSPQPPFGGYGPSFSNPRTGQLLAADIMLEYSFLTNRINTSNVFESAALSLGEEETATSFMEAIRNHNRNCSIGAHMQLNTMVGQTLARTLQQGADVSKKMVEESLHYLILHEVGHTLGLNHNMRATQARSYETAYDISAQDDGLAGSVMDYPSINFAPPGKDQAHYYSIIPGTYDTWAIQFGYDPDMDDPQKRAAHLARSAEKGLAFGNDADDMRSPGKGIDPRVNVFDMTDDAIRFAEDRMKLAQNAMGKLRQNFIKDGQSYQELRNAYVILTADMAWQGRVASRYIGGVYVERAVAGQDGETAPYRPVEERRQKQAMQMLRTYLLSPNAFEADPVLLQHLAIQRRGFLHGGGTEDPKIHARVATIQADILNHILHPATMQRMSDSALYGNNYSVTEVLSDLTKAVFEDDSRTAVNSHRQELQTMYVKGLINIFNGAAYNNIARSNAFSNLKSIRNNMARWRGDAATRAHRDHIAYLINKALEVLQS
ncbi:zinc-dependent metalloprotease [Kordiimonas aquimaris]|uniref:zinc-dependent metalloprotease n=1 Tax=Kordiimonas aquimaris TaxID=707591 RepID=UPI0021D3DD3D|nr:zinc-dependent metalloprotease [Kordiimonas aquimaris]